MKQIISITIALVIITSSLYFAAGQMTLPQPLWHSNLEEQIPVFVDFFQGFNQALKAHVESLE